MNTWPTTVYSCLIFRVVSTEGFHCILFAVWFSLVCGEMYLDCPWTKGGKQKHYYSYECRWLPKLNNEPAFVDVFGHSLRKGSRLGDLDLTWKFSCVVLVFSHQVSSNEFLSRKNTGKKERTEFRSYVVCWCSSAENPVVHVTVGEKIACATISPHLYKLSYVQVQC